MTSDSIYTIGGTVQAGSGLYVERAADAELLQMCREGAFAYVLTARQMGKSSLMTETARRLNDESIRTVIIDLNGIGTDLSAEQWYLGLATEVADQLDLATDALAWWNERPHMGPAQRLTAFLRAVVLHEVAAPIVIFIDEIDTTLSLAFTDDFYAAIRALYNARAQQPALERLSFVLIGVAIPGDLIKDPQRTPFNIGRQIELSDFRADEALLFAAGLNLPAEQGRRALARILDWTNGHPYLTQRLCAAVAAQPSAERTPECVDVLVNDLFLGEQSRQDNNVQFVRDMLTRRAPDPIRVLTTYRDVLRGLVVLDDERALPKAHLKLAGVVRRDGRALETRNRIYATVFDAHWVNAALPPDYLPRRLQRMGLIAIGMLVGLSLLLGVFLIGSRSREEELQREKDVAVSAQQTSEANKNAVIAANQTSQANEQILQTAIGEANAARATAVSSGNAAEVANHAALRQLMVSDAQAALAEGNLDQARLRAIAALRADPSLAQAEMVLEAAAFAPSTRRLFEGHIDTVNGVAWSPDGTQVASASDDTTLRIWDVASGRELRKLEGHKAAIYDVAWSPDQKQIASASADNTIRIWDVASGTSLLNLEGHTSEVYSVAWSPNGTQVASASADRTLMIWDAASGKILRTLTDHTGAVRDVAFSPDGTEIVSGADDNTVRVWDVANGQSMRRLAGHSAPVRTVAFSPDGKTVVSGSNDRVARVWDVSSGQGLRTLIGHSAAVRAVEFSSDGKRIVSGSDDGTLYVWNVTNGQGIQMLKGHNAAILALALSSDGKRIVTGSGDRTLRVWDLGSSANLWALDGNTAVRIVVFSLDGKTLVVGLEDGTIQLWNVAKGQIIHTLTGSVGILRTVAFSPDGNTVISGAGDGTLQVWDVTSGQSLRTLMGHSAVVWTMVFSPDSTLAVSGADDYTLQVWDVASGQSLRTLIGHKDAVRAVSFSPNGKMLVSGSEDGTLRVWDVASGQGLSTLIGHKDAVRAVAFSPDGKIIVSGTYSGAIQVWDVASGQNLRTLMGHSATIRAIAFSPDATMIVSGSSDGTLRVWDMVNDESLHTLRGHTAAVTSVAFRPDGKTVVSASEDGTVRLWPIYSVQELIDWTYANRYVPEFTAEQRARYGAALVSMDATPAASPAATAAP